MSIEVDINQFPFLIFTDGACSGNPGPGGWAAIVAHKGRNSERNWWRGGPDNEQSHGVAGDNQGARDHSRQARESGVLHGLNLRHSWNHAVDLGLEEKELDQR